MSFGLTRGEEGPVIGWMAAALLAFGTAVLLALVGGSVSLNIQAQRGFEEIAAARSMAAYAEGLRTALLTSEASQRGFVLTGNEIYLAPYATAKQEALNQWELLRPAASSMPGHDAALDRLGVILRDKIQEMDDVIRLQREGDRVQALQIVQTNRGKALMDEANVFLSKFVRVGDARLREASAEQRARLSILRTLNIVSAFLIAGVVAAVVSIILRYASTLAAARNHVVTLNSELEERVKTRTAELVAARDRAELLMSEVNHRVANSLALVASMVKLQARATDDNLAKELLNKVHDRVYAVGAVHQRLYVSHNVSAVDLGPYLTVLVEQLEQSMHGAGNASRVRHSIAEASLPTDKAISLGLVTTELVTNAFKYAYPKGSGEIRVDFSVEGDEGKLAVSDDGIGCAGKSSPSGTGLGTKIITSLVASLAGRIVYGDGEPGTTALVSFPL